MLQKSICIIFVISAYALLSDGVPHSQSNETKVVVTVKIDQSERDLLRAELESQRKLLDRLVKELDQRISRSYPLDCSEVKSSGIHDILIPNFSSEPFKVVCDASTSGGGWTIILRRMDGRVDFYRNWNAYKNGFGDLSGEFFIGLDKLRAMTENSCQELLILLEDFEGETRFEKYEEFAIGDEDHKYVLHTLGKASGTAGDSLTHHRGKKFSTFDRDNDDWKEGNCAEVSTGAWWYFDYMCHFGNLAGVYNDTSKRKGVNWYTFRGWYYSNKRAIMMIRPKK
ncbi:microfibril-associated glycoprotein 4-like [Drosophila innubila]|uniref:microfibril-associated glycoprotein 4-like n=1 Tax=Drosophila innubila TaxID=198719 RepID=UPI00148E05C4|nr:microfibril-associated glycoprotein 4-like [Drosophila innubila]